MREHTAATGICTGKGGKPDPRHKVSSMRRTSGAYAAVAQRQSTGR